MSIFGEVSAETDGVDRGSVRIVDTKTSNLADLVRR
jgi:hypothetical protein